MKKLTLLLLVSASVATFAQTTPGTSANLVTGDDYAPYSDKKAPEGGLATEIVKKALGEAKVDAKIDWQPWTRGYEETKAGNFAATFPYYKNSERERDMLYSEPIVKILTRIFIKAGSKKFDFSNLQNLTGSTMCLPLGWSKPVQFEELIKANKVKVQAPKDLAACAKLVESDRADFFITEELNGRAAIVSSGVQAGSVVQADIPPLSEAGLYLIASKNHPTGKEFIATFNKGLEALKKNGSYDKIIKSYMK